MHSLLRFHLTGNLRKNQRLRHTWCIKTRRVLVGAASCGAPHHPLGVKNLSLVIIDFTFSITMLFPSRGESSRRGGEEHREAADLPSRQDPSPGAVHGPALLRVGSPRGEDGQRAQGTVEAEPMLSGGSVLLQSGLLFADFLS